MKEKLKFQSTGKEFLNEILKKSDRKIFNFLNSHDVYQFRKNSVFRKSVLDNEKYSINLPDGTIVSILLGRKKMRGTDFTRFVLESEFVKNKKQLFIGLEEKDLDVLTKRFGLEKKNVKSYNPPYIKGNKFEEKEINKVANLINQKNIDYIWIGLGCPKQNILSKDLFEKSKAKKFFNVGAALDFVLDKKKQAPLFWQKIGLEWFYRLVTDFKYSKIKIWRSFLGSFYALFIIK